MNRILSSNTIKNVFAALGAKTTDSNYSVALLNSSDLSPAGGMTMSNLASVLGAIRFIGSATATDIDSKTEPGIYSHGNSVSGDGGYGLVFVFGQSDGYLAQIDFMFYSGRVKWRNRASSSSSWGNWKELKLIE